MPSFTTIHREHRGGIVVLPGMTPRKTYEMLCVATICAAMSWGCGGKAKTRTSPTPKSVPPSAAAADKAPVAASPHVGVSEDLLTHCKLRFSGAEEAPKFDYDDAELLAADRDILQQVADCLTHGPLQGRSVQLI